MTRPASWAVPEVIGSRPVTGMESALAEVLAEIVGVEWVSADSNFCDDLGADSLVRPRFCARIRKRSDLLAVSIKDGYRNPTIRALAVSQEDTTFDSDHFTIGPGCGVPIGDARWRGNPATEFRDHHGFAGAATIVNARRRG